MLNNSNENDVSKILDSLEYTNPHFPIVNIIYGNNYVPGGEEASSPYFNNYEPFKDDMNKEMIAIYPNWAYFGKEKRNEIIERKNKRLEYHTYNVTYNRLYKLANSFVNASQERVEEEKIEAGVRVKEADIVNVIFTDNECIKEKEIEDCLNYLRRNPSKVELRSRVNPEFRSSIYILLS